MTTNPTIIFMGTPEFAVATLRAIHAVFPIAAVVTVPDKPKGRGLQVQPSAVKQAALELGITTILQPATLKDEAFEAELRALKPDIIAVVAFRILPPNIFSLPRLGAFNIHGSLLPKYRGAAPINWAIINGERETGVTSFLLAESVDTGSMLGRRVIPIPDGTTAGELHDALMPLAAELAVETCQRLASGTAKPKPQDDIAATKAPKIFRETCKIDWTKPAHEVRSFIHGLSPYPGAWTAFADGKTAKILRVSAMDWVGDAAKPLTKPETGEFIVTSDALFISCGEGVLSVQEIQPEGKRAMTTKEFLRGYRGEQHGRLG